MFQGTEDGPSGQRGEVFLEDEGDQEEGVLAALVEYDIWEIYLF